MYRLHLLFALIESFRLSAPLACFSTLEIPLVYFASVKEWFKVLDANWWLWVVEAGAQNILVLSTLMQILWRRNTKLIISSVISVSVRIFYLLFVWILNGIEFSTIWIAILIYNILTLTFAKFNGRAFNLNWALNCNWTRNMRKVVLSLGYF